MQSTKTSAVLPGTTVSHDPVTQGLLAGAVNKLRAAPNIDTVTATERILRESGAEPNLIAAYRVLNTLPNSTPDPNQPTVVGLLDAALRTGQARGVDAATRELATAGATGAHLAAGVKGQGDLEALWVAAQISVIRGDYIRNLPLGPLEPRRPAPSSGASEPEEMPLPKGPVPNTIDQMVAYAASNPKAADVMVMLQYVEQTPLRKHLLAATRKMVTITPQDQGLEVWQKFCEASFAAFDGARTSVAAGGSLDAARAAMKATGKPPATQLADLFADARELDVLWSATKLTLITVRAMAAGEIEP